MGRFSFALWVSAIAIASSAAVPVVGGDIANKADWPAEPVMVSPVEGVIEAFWNPSLNATARWSGQNGTLSSTWDSCRFTLNEEGLHDSARISRRYQLDIGDYQRIRVRLRTGEGVRTTVLASVDGAEVLVAEELARGNDAFEIAGPIAGKKLTGLTLKFTCERKTTLSPAENSTHGVQGSPCAIILRWILLEKDGVAWTPPEEPFAGMIAQGPVGRFEPGLGLLFGREGLQQMRDIVASDAFAASWETDAAYAQREFPVEPASLLRPYSLYAPSRYGRDADENYETAHDGIILALAGLLERNEDYLRQAARHAIVLARIGEWSEGFVDRMPGYPWYHSGFAPNIATIKAALLLDWTWHYLTPEGRHLIRDAIARKGLPHLEMARDAMTNQGVRFGKGMILGKMAAADSPDDPEVREYVQDCLSRINRKVEDCVRPDGTFSESMNYYGKGTMACLPVIYQAASRCLGRPIRELASPRMLPAMHYVLTADRRLNAAMAAFCAGPLEDKAFACQCMPTRLLCDFLGKNESAGTHEGNRIEYVFFGLAPLWAAQALGTIPPAPQDPPLPAFKVFPDGGEVYGGSRNPAAPRFHFESGLWDGHGHSWFHKNSVTLDARGERLLIKRFHLAYSDARSRYTMSTKLYNTFAPSGRDQDASGTPGKGARLLVAEDLGPLAVVESDDATAWKSGVERAVRRVLFIRPNVMIVQDDALFTASEPGVQSWNSFQPWERVGGRACQSRAAASTVRLTALSPQPLKLTSGEDSVSREAAGEAPVYRAAFSTNPGRQHHILTIIEAIGPDAADRAAVHIRKAGSAIEVRPTPRLAVQVLPANSDSAAHSLDGFASDGSILFVVRTDSEVTLAGTLGATWLETPNGRIEGKGFLTWPRRVRKELSPP